MTDTQRPRTTDLDLGSIPDHRERPSGAPTVSHVSEHGEVAATIADGQVQDLRIDPDWLHGADADDAADVMTATINAALDEWQAKQTELLEGMLPDLKVLHGSLSQVRQQDGEGWVRAIAEPPHEAL